MRQLDIAAMSVSLWLLASMIVDIVTPKELTVYMIGAVMAPTVVILAICCWRRIPRLDFAIVFATLWLSTVMVLEFVSPKPLSLIMAVIAIVPLVIVGCVINYSRWRRLKKSRSNSARLSS